jgi:hypothetical protein
MGKETGIKLADQFEGVALFIDRGEGDFVIEKCTRAEVFCNGTGCFPVAETGDILSFHLANL